MMIDYDDDDDGDDDDDDDDEEDGDIIKHADDGRDGSCSP